MHLPLFIKRLRNKAIKENVEFKFATEFKDLIYDAKGRISGIETKDEKVITLGLLLMLQESLVS